MRRVGTPGVVLALAAAGCGGGPPTRRAGAPTLVEPAGGRRRVHALAEIDVASRPGWLAPGAQAPASRTPTLASRLPASALTTHVPPDRALLRTSPAAALRAHAPFVLVFAIPKF